MITLKHFSWLILVLLVSCKSESPIAYLKISGKTMGTAYNITYEGVDPASVKRSVDSLLVRINNGVSTYETGSIISLFNRDYEGYMASEDTVVNAYFLDNYELSSQVHKTSNGAFEPTIMPVVNYWGFGYSGRAQVSEVDTLKVQELMRHIGFHKIKREGDKLVKQDSLLELDFSAVAKGYGVDRVAALLKDLGFPNHYVEIGGEVYASGVNPAGIEWRTGVSLPSPNAERGQFQEIVEIAGMGIATSGNYINFYESGLDTFSHTINPSTGFPERSNLISATVIASSCAIADAYATACMVLGVDKSREMINLQKGIDGILIYTDEQGAFQSYDSRKK